MKNLYGFRADCPYDSDTFKRCLSAEYVCEHLEYGDVNIPDTENYVVTDANFRDIVNVMARIPDSHVMLETLTLGETNGLRTYNPPSPDQFEQDKDVLFDTETETPYVLFVPGTSMYDGPENLDEHMLY